MNILSALGASPYCLPCEQAKNWIEITLVDEHNQPFNNVQGTLTDALGNVHAISLGARAIFIENLVPGFVTLEFDNSSWLTEAFKRKPDQANSSEANSTPVDAFVKKPGCKGTSRQLVHATT